MLSAGAKLAGARGFEPPLRKFFVMLDLMAVRTKDRAFTDLTLDSCLGKATPDHVCQVEVFTGGRLMVKLKRPEITEPTALASERVLVGVQPLPELCPPRVGDGAFALLALPPSVYFPADDSANLERFFRAFLKAVSADHHDGDSQRPKGL
jgi:hypothetical protein